MINFTCPHCHKAFTVKDQLAGKRAQCSGCKKVVIIPAPTAQPAGAAPAAAMPAAPAPSSGEVEDLAAAAFADEPKKEEPKEVKTFEVQCPQCDEKVQFNVELVGKQAPCPACKRIVKVPLLVKDEPKDWRKIDTKGPSGARRDEQAAPEGAWGSTTSTAKVSRQALVEADVIKEEKEKLTARQWAWRVGLIGAPLVLVVVGAVIFLNLRSTSQQKDALDQALKAVASADGKARLTAAAVRRGAGEFHLRLNSSDGLEEGRKHFQKARAQLEKAPAGPEREALLRELALSQISLGGDGQQMEKRTRMDWDKAVDEIRQTLQLLPATDPTPAYPNLATPGPRVAALREVCRQLASRGLNDKAASLALAVLPRGDEMRNEGVAQVGLEIVRVGDAKLVETGIVEAFDHATVPKSPSALALYVALKRPEMLQQANSQPKKGDKPGDTVLFGQVVGLAYQGKAEDARRQAGSISAPLLRAYAFVAIGNSMAQPEAARPDTEAAITLIEQELKGTPMPASLLGDLAQLAVRAGLGDRIKAVSATAGDASLRRLIQVELLKVRLASTAEKADDAWADEGLDKQSVWYGLAREAIARHNAKRDSGVIKAVSGWEESVQPFGYVGAALGLQDASQ